jgi:hypothetical protein
MERLLGLPVQDWSTIFYQRMQGVGGAPSPPPRIEGTRPSVELSNYAGTYRNPMYGDAQVSLQDGKLTLRILGFTLPLEHWHYDTFRAKFVGAGAATAFITFALNAQGKIENLTLNLPGIAEYPFKRSAETPAGTASVSLSEAELQKFAGKYELKTPPVEMSVELVGGKLKATVPGQPVYTLVPVAANRFSIEGAPAGFSIQFEMAEGKVISLTLVQGSGPSLVLLPKQ